MDAYSLLATTGFTSLGQLSDQLPTAEFVGDEMPCIEALWGRIFKDYYLI